MGQVTSKDSTMLKDGLRRLGAWSATQEGKRFLGVFGLALLARLVMLPYRGFYDDVQAFVTWGYFLDHHFAHFYSLGQHLGPPPDYPPLAMYLFGTLDAVYALGFHLVGKTPILHVDNSRTLDAIFKLPTLVADLGLMVAIYAIARRRLPERIARLAAVSYAFSPVILFAGVLWGQIDPIFVLALALALWCAWRGNGLLAGVLVGLAVMIKPQPVIFAPLLLVYLWRSSGRRQALRALAGMAGTVVVVCLPYLVPPHPEMLAFQHDLALWERTVPYTSVSGFNLWWLLGLQQVPYTAPVLGPLSPNILGWALFFAVLALVLAGVWRDRSPGHLFFSAGLLAVAFFVLTPLQHERYVLPALALFLLATVFDMRNAIYYVLATGLATLNVVLVVIDPVFSDSKIPYMYTIGRHFLKTHPQIFVVLAGANVLLLAALVVVEARRMFAAQPAALPEAATLQGRGVPAAAMSLAASADGLGTLAMTASEPAAEPVTRRSVTIVLPAYNEEQVIAQTVQACLRAAERYCPSADVVVVDDGSRDRTGALVDALAAADRRVTALHHPANRGYGAALLTGFAAARSELLFFMDSDGQFDIDDIAALLRLEATRPGAVIAGYRERRQDGWVRRLNAWGWKHVVRVVLGLWSVRDIDCAFKLFPTELVRACQVTSEGAMVNTELLVKLQRMGVPILETPVHHYPRSHGGATGANPAVIARAFVELVRLRLRLSEWQMPRVPEPAEEYGLAGEGTTPNAMV